MNNTCIICGEYTDFSGCKNCGKLIFKDDINLIINNKTISAKIYALEKKIMIYGIDHENIKLSAGQIFCSALFDQLGIIGILLNPYSREKYDNENVIDIKSIKKYKIIDDNLIKIIDKKNFTIHIENKNNRQKLINLLNR